MANKSRDKTDVDSELCGAISSLKITQGEKKSSAVEYIDIPDGQILILKKDAVVYLHGIVCISIHAGKVDLFGYIPTVGKVYEVNSTSYTQHLYIKNITDENNKDGIKEDDLINAGLKQEDYKNLKKKLTNLDAVLVCKSVYIKKFHVLEKHFELDLFPDNKNNFKFQEEAGKWDVVTGNNEWDKLVEDIEKPDASFYKIFVLGARKTGKGLLSRYLTNKFLTKYNKVLMIDLDPAQSEFTVSGSISACILTKPLFGPNYMHPKSPEYSVFVGSVDLEASYRYYLKCVEKLVDYCRSLPKMPVVIQFNGFTNDIAFNIISSIICISKPDRIAELYSNMSQYNFQRSINIENIEKWKNFTSNLSAAPFTLYRFESINNESAPTIDAKALRRMRLVIYFYDAQLVDRKFRMSSLRNTEGKAKVRLGQVLAICKDTNIDKIYQCFGWGIVNSMRDGFFTLLSPFQFNEGGDFVFVLTDYLVLAPNRHSVNQTYAELFSLIDDYQGFKWFPKNVPYHGRRRY